MYEELKYWQAREEPNDGKPAPDEFIDYVTTQLGNSYSIIEVGPGVGRIFPAYKNVKELECCDIHPKYYDKLAAEALKMDFALHFTEVPVGKLPFEDNQFDSSVCVQVLLHQRPQHIEAMMHELVRVAQRAIVISMHYEVPIKLAEHCFNHDYLGICKNNGWTVSNIVRLPEQLCFTMEGN